MIRTILILVCMMLSHLASTQDLRLMTYNIRYDNPGDGENAWPLRKAGLVALIRFYSPDIFGIQEGLPQQVRYIDDELGDYQYVGVGRDGEGKGEHSVIFYNQTKYAVAETHTFWLSETPNEISKGWDAALPRVCTYALLMEKKTNRKFWVFNTHLDHIGAMARKNGVGLILSTIRKVNTQRLPVVLMGDFNSEPDSEVIALARKEMDDSRIVSQIPPFGPTGTFNAFEFNKPVTKLIDYIFVSRGSGSVLKYAVLSNSDNLHYPSDHLPVLVEWR
jgi:endonuclease/exonuclease/phosphatase family metal-dependent hydrolase